MGLHLFNKLYLRMWSRKRDLAGHPDVHLKRHFDATSKFVDLYWIPYTANRKIAGHAVNVRVRWEEVRSAIREAEEKTIPEELASHQH